MASRTSLSLAEALDRHSIPEPNSGCTLWLGEVNSKGYGRIVQGGGIRRRRFLAHRVAYEAAYGPSCGAVIAHRCDNPACVNPAHLFATTQPGNLHDMRAKGRGCLPPTRRGSESASAKLTEAEVAQIRERLCRGEKHRVIAADFGVCRATVTHIRAGRNWRAALEPRA